METILSKMTNISTENLTFYKLEDTIRQLTHEMMVEAIQLYLRRADYQVVETYLSQGWEIAGTSTRRLLLTFGEVEYTRTRLRRKNKLERKEQRSFTPLDQKLGLLPNKHFTPLLLEKASKLGAITTFRQASEIFELLTDISVSPMTIHSCVQKAGEVIEEYLPLIENKVEKKRSPRTLFIEGDGVHVGNQEKGKSHELHRFVIHEGIKGTTKRRELIHSYDIVAYSAKEGFEKVLAYLEKHYDLSDTTLITNSDGGVGYSPESFKDHFGHLFIRHEHFTDAYHVAQNIRRKLHFNPKLQNELRNGVKSYDLDKVVTVLDTAESIESTLENKGNLKKLQELRSYLERHWEYIEPMSKRELEVERGIGVCESGHKTLTHRMKRQGRNWKKKGVKNMKNLITSIKNGQFQSILELSGYKKQSLNEEVQEEIKVTMREILKQGSFEQHSGVYPASIPNYGSKSSPIGRLKISLAC